MNANVKPVFQNRMNRKDKAKFSEQNVVNKKEIKFKKKKISQQRIITILL